MTNKNIYFSLTIMILFGLSGCDYIKPDYSKAQDLTIKGQIKGDFRVQVGNEVLFEPESSDVQFKIGYYSVGDKCHHTPWLTKQSYQETDYKHYSASLSPAGHYKISIPDRYRYRGCDWYISSIVQTGHHYPADTKQARFDVFCQKYIFDFGFEDKRRETPRTGDKCVTASTLEEPAYKNGLEYEFDGSNPRPPITVNIRVSDDVLCSRCPDWSSYKHLQPYDHEFEPTPEMAGTFEAAP